MTKTEEKIVNMCPEIKAEIDKNIGTPEMLYETAYLIAQNAHLTQMNKPEEWERKLQTIEYCRSRLEEVMDRCGLDGKETFADIASDYFEDFANYRTRQLTIDDSLFIDIVRNLTSA